MKTKFILTALFISLSGSIYAQQTQVFNSSVQIGTTTPYKQEGKKLYLGVYNDNSDELSITRYNLSNDSTELRINIGDDTHDKFVIGNTYWENPSVYNKFFVVSTDGKVGIKSPNPSYELEVNGTIKTKAVLVSNTGWADFVFKKDYRLRPLKEVESHIEQYSRLPEMPSESEVNANGVDLAKMNVKLLQKIEELTLYIIQQEARISELENKIK